MDHVARLESEVAALKRKVDELHGTIDELRSERPPTPQHPREVFQGRPIAGVDDDGDPVAFPETGNTFNVQLLDRSFAVGPGAQTVIDTPRSEEQFTAARTIDGRWLIENEPYLVVRTPQPPGTTGDKGEFWFIDQPRIEIVLVSSLIKTGPYYPGSLLHAAPDGTITSVTAIWVLDLNEDA